MKTIECVTVCVDYADFLAWTLPHNRPLFNRMVVVTAEHDVATQRLCRHYHVRCLISTVMFAGGQRFNKGAAVEAGLRDLDFKDWVIHLDADVVLPPRFQALVRQKQLDEQALYGCDRFMVPSFEAWARFVGSPELQHDASRLRATTFPLGYRVMRDKPDDQSYLPIGFFQMFNRASQFLRDPYYPTNHDTAAASDMEFAARWPALYRHLLPEVVAYHLESEGASAMGGGANWLGRTTPTFGLPPVVTV